MTDPVNPLPGVKATEITLTALTPDVVTAVMQRITDSVVAGIPADAISKIAGEIIASGSVVRRTYDGYSTKEVRYEIADQTKIKVIALIEKEVAALAEKYVRDPEVQKIIAEEVRAGVATALGSLQDVVANTVVQRIASNVAPGNFIPISDKDVALDHLRFRTNLIQQRLVDRGLLFFGEIPQ